MRFSAAAIIIASACASGDSDHPGAWTPNRVATLDTAWMTAPLSAEFGVPGQVLELRDGTFLVASGETGFVNRHDATGTLLHGVVTAGAGPRQAQPPFSVAVQHDTLFVTPADPFSREVVWVHLGDSTAGRRSVSGTGAALERCAANGRCLVQRDRDWASGLPVSRAGEAIQDTLILGVIDESAPPRWLANLPGPTLVAFDWPDGPVPVGIVSHELSPGSLFVAGASLAWTYRDDSGTLCAWRLAGGGCERRSVDFLPRHRIPAAAADSTARLLADARTTLARNRVAASRDLRFVSHGTLPRVRSLVPGIDGTVWLEVWQVADMNTRLYVRVEDYVVSDTAVTLPIDVSPLWIGDSIIIGTTAKPDGSVSLIGLRRSPRD